MAEVANRTLRERTRGRWFEILIALGIDRRFLRNRHGPCPACGGKDRFRWDDLDGDGTFFCNQCGAGSGADLVMRVTGWRFGDAARAIEEVVGQARPRPARLEATVEQKRATLRKLWQASAAVRPGDAVDCWFRNRGLGMEIYPKCLRAAANVRHSGPPASWHWAMLALLTDSAGRSVNIHRTFITADGRKAPVDPVRMVCQGAVPPGSAVRLAPPSVVLGVAEGIETACAAMRLFAVPTWATLSAGRLQTFAPPAGTERLVIFGDNDANGTGQRAAYDLAARLSGQLAIDVRIAPIAGTDWNDVLEGSP